MLHDFASSHILLNSATEVTTFDCLVDEVIDVFIDCYDDNLHFTPLGKGETEVIHYHHSFS